MLRRLPSIHGQWRRFHERLDQLLYALSAYALPVVIGLISLAALFVWKAQHPLDQPRDVEFQVIRESGTVLTPASALARLASRPDVPYLDTNRSEDPYWFSFTVQSGDAGKSTVEFPSRHAYDLQCWNAVTLTSVGRADRQFSEGSIFPIKAGFALSLPSSSTEMRLLCRSSFVGPARLTVLLWPAAGLQMAAEDFHRKSGLLDGGLIVLAVFMIITALIVRQSTYVLFAAWLVMNLRVAALSAGWDNQWLGYTVPPEWILPMRSVSMALYCVLTITLFTAMFREELSKVGYLLMLRCLQCLCIPLLVLSAALPYKSFLPILWITSGLTVTVLVFYLARILLLTRSKVALWYSASFILTLLASLSEVLSAALDLRSLTGAVNSVTAALSSSLLAALAIAEQMRQEQKQRLEVQAELEHTYEAIPVGLFTLEMAGHFMSANPALHAILGSSTGSPVGTSWLQHFGGDSWSQLLNMVHTRPDGELEIEARSKVDGGSKRLLVKATIARGKIEGSLQDITEKSKALEELRFMANNDPLTKVFNRRGIEKMLDVAMKQLEQGKPLALAYLDLDRFKLINGLYGHAVGDEVLKQVCGRITNMLTGSQQIGRVGGDEFIIVMPDTPIQLASWTCRGIVSGISTAPYRIGDKAFQVRGSIGLIEIMVGTQIKDALATADRACRDAKTGMGDGLVVYEKSAAAFHEREAEFKLVERLSASTAPNGLFLEMQPIMSLKRPLDSLDFEVLLRMRDHDGSVIPAGRIIAAAESSGRTGVVDRWVLSTTLSWIETHFKSLPRTQFICMNLSGASLNDERFVQDAFAMLQQHSQAARKLCIEITESVALHDMGNTRRFIDKVRSYGVKVALDDFGAGYTSFSYLKELPADVLKIDGSFIVHMNTHPANIAIVEAIVSLATSLGMKTIAEWAEDSATVQTLAEIGVDYVQGYAVARPKSPAELLAADSAAGFIQDLELMQYVRMISASSLSLAQMDLLGVIDTQKVH